MRRTFRLVTVGAIAWTLSGCGSSPIGLPVPDEPLESTLADFFVGPLTAPSAFSLILLRAVRTDQTQTWDYVFALDEQGVAELFPRGAVLEPPSTAGLQIVAESFDDLTEAPEFGYVTDAPVAVQVGDVLAAVSERRCGSFNRRRYGKLEILVIDRERGEVTFKWLANPNCEIRSLVPGEAGEL